MRLLAVAYQEERPEMEAADLTALVIRALGMVVGKTVREMIEGNDVYGVYGVYGVSNKTHFIATKLITGAAQTLVEAHELDIRLEQVNSHRIGRILKKMRLAPVKHAVGGKRGWNVSLEEVVRWANSYGLDASEITGISLTPTALSPHKTNAVNAVNAVNINTANVATSLPLNPWHGAIRKRRPL